MGNELIISIGRQLNIPGKVDNEWMCRVIYSIAGQMGLASLWDYDEDEDTVSIQHFKERIAEIFAAYEELYPSIKFIFPEKKSDLIDEIYHIYLRSGFFYHSAYRISPAVPSFATYNNLTICRGSSPDVQLFMSGLGYYSRQKSSADKSIAEVFGLQNQGLEDYLGGLLGDGEWVPIDWPDSAEFMYLGPSFRLGYWKQTPDKDGRISLARYGEPSKVYAFYRYYSMDLAKNSWLNRAGQSLAEALRLSACQELDIEFTELVTGFRVRQNQKGDFIDIYLYDSLSSGAGYAVSIEASIQQLLIKTRELLSSCNCDSACHKCLKHYRNQYVHGLLDRSAALDLLTWAEKGVRSPMLPVYEQRNSLQSVEQILQFSGVHIDFDHEPIEAESFHGKKRIVVYPAMWARPTEKNMVFVSDSYLKYAKPYALKTIVGGL